MPGPWEDFAPSTPSTAPAAATSDNGPWMDFAPKPVEKKASKSFLEKLGETNLVKGIVSAVTLPHDVMTGEAHVPGTPDAQAIPGTVPYGSPQSSGERIADLASVAIPPSVAAGTGRLIAQAAGVGKKAIPVAAAEAPSVAPTIQELKSVASSQFESPVVAAVEIKPTAISKYSTETRQTLNSAGLDENLAPKTFSILGKLEKVPEDSVVTAGNIQSLRRTLGNVAKSPDPTERLAASQSIERLDGLLPKLEKSDIVAGDMEAANKVLETARANWGAAKRAEALDAKINQAQVRSSAANSGMNVSNAIRQRMADIVLSPKLQRGFTQSELDAMRHIVEGSAEQNIARMAGNIMGGGGGLGAMVAGGIGKLAAGPIGAATPLGGYAIKALQNKLTLEQAQKISESVRMRSPLASSLAKYEQNAKAFHAQSNPRTATGYKLAARNLSNNLKSIGVRVGAEELVRKFHSNQSE